MAGAPPATRPPAPAPTPTPTPTPTPPLTRADHGPPRGARPRLAPREPPDRATASRAWPHGADGASRSPRS
ncbi:hypothetical protein C1701_18070 [Actinoalloteichus sp. AHMU CJ021]|nr:hypothetical protein C1701_18070 [Actinoalloteichus sp. AHMU CJ021]